MHRSKCNGRHDDIKAGSWRDTAGRRWVEWACKECGRLTRKVAS